jgi:hypothetical protein
MAYTEILTFDKGLITKKSSMTLEDGELAVAQGMSYETFGMIDPRSSKQAVSTAQVGTINGMHRNVNHVILTDAGNVRNKWDLDGYCDLYIPPNGNFTLLGTMINDSRPVFCDHEEFTFIVTGGDKKVFLDGAWYEWDVPAPIGVPGATAGSAGNPSGVYTLYYTYLITFPNGFMVETPPSPAGSISVTSQKIEWTGISICPYAGSLTVHRKLYRYSSGLIETYYVTTLENNTATTYSDNGTDASLMVNAVIDTADYTTPPPNPSFAVSHLQRVFCMAENYLYPSEPYLPFNYDVTNVLQITQMGDNLIGGVVWGDQLFMASRAKWYRLHGSDPGSWQIKNTFAHAGSLNKHTIKATRWGILSYWHDGIYLFDGSVSKNITAGKISKDLFSGISSAASCYSEWDGRRYYFHYPTTGTTLSKRLVIDMMQYPNIIVFHDDFVPTAHSFHEVTGINYYGFNGYHYEEGGSDAVSLSMRSGDRVCKDVLKQKQLEYLYYDCYTNGKPLVVTIYMDDVLVHTITINNSTRTKDRVVLPNKQGYRFYISMTAVDARGMIIYEPWAISVNITGI